MDTAVTQSSGRRIVADLRQRSWSWLLRNLVLPVGDVAFRQGLMKRLRFLQEAQWWDPERLCVYRERALNSLLTVAYQEVAFYRKLMDDAGIRPDDVRRLEDLSHLPVATKEKLRSAYPDLTTRNTGQKTFEVCSSGSTGMNFRVKEDAETAGFYRASFMLALEWAGWRAGEPHLQTGMTLERSFDRRLKDHLLRCHYISAFDLTDSRLDAALDLLEACSIKHVWGYPGSLYCLAQRALKRGWNEPMRSVVTWGDNLYSHYRQTIERAFRSRVCDTYGCGEGVQVAAQCGYMNVYHVHTPDVIVECVDHNGRRVGSGELGNVILTRLHPGPMPLIRYQVGDVGVLGSSRVCDCGRGYEILDSIQGRDTDIVITPSGNRLIVHFFTGIFEHFAEIDCFQVVQENIESILVRVVLTVDSSKDLVAKIIAKLQTHGAHDLNIAVEVVKEIPLSPSGKRRFVIAKSTAEFDRLQQRLPADKKQLKWSSDDSF